MKLTLKRLTPFLIFSLFLQPLHAKELVDKVVASIENEIVLLSELNSFGQSIKKPGVVDETLLLGESIDSLKNDRKKQLEYLIREKIVDAEVKREGMSTPDEQIQGQLLQMARKNQMTLSEFSNYIVSQGYNVEQYKDLLRKRSERQAFFEKEIISKLRITDDDAYAIYQEKVPNAHPSIAEYKIAQIFFSSKKAGDDGALARAQAALSRLKSGESFEALANQLDETPGANKDGVLGSFRAGEFLPALEKAVSSIPEGATTGIVKGPTGYHILKLLSKTTVLDPGFAKYKESIKAALVQQNFERQLKNWFEFKKQELHIQTYDETAG